MFNKSFTLIEIIVATFLITVGTVGAFALIQRTVAFTAISSSRLVAANLAQEGIEIVRNIRDGNWLEARTNPGISWDDGLAGCSTGCEADYNDLILSPDASRFLKVENGFYNYDSGTNTHYKRKITLVPQVDILEVSVEVTWQERARMHQVISQTKLYNWR